MNPQYMPQQQYANPTQGLPPNAGCYGSNVPPAVRSSPTMPPQPQGYPQPLPPHGTRGPQGYAPPNSAPAPPQQNTAPYPMNKGVPQIPSLPQGGNSVLPPPTSQQSNYPPGPVPVGKPPVANFNTVNPQPQIVPPLPSVDNNTNQITQQISGLQVSNRTAPSNDFGQPALSPGMSAMNGDHKSDLRQASHVAYNQPPPGNVLPPVPSQMQPPMPQPQYPQSGFHPPINQYNAGHGPHMPPPLMQPQPNMPPAVGQPPMHPPPGQRVQAPMGQYVNGSQHRPPMPPLANPMGQMPYPPQPGMPPMQPHMAGPYPQQNEYSPQQQKQLDPDQMPSPIQVMLEDQKTRSGLFSTNQKGLVPPLVSTDFVTQDQGNASPRFIRSSMYNVPINTEVMKHTLVPFGLVISPFARTTEQEYPPPIVNFGEMGPVRCIRCKAYICPYMQFIDSGKRFQCLFCKATTEVPNEYFQHLDHTGQRVDKYERPELVLGAYEFVATKEYCTDNVFPPPPAMIFVIDVSYNNIKSGLIHLLCAQMKSIISNLPVDQGQETSNMKVGFITYNNTVHFYNIKGTLAQPQMLVVGDVQEMFMPLLDGFLCDVEESAAVIDSLMEQIPAMLGDTRETETVLAPAIQAGLEALKASGCAGKLLVFHSSLPIAEAPGKLKNRDDRKLLGTDKEKTVLAPQNNVYNNLGQECVAAGCSVDLFIFNNSYVDIATIGQVSRLTGGDIYKYTYFQADVDGQRLIEDIIYNISRPIAFNAIMRVRTSTGVRPTDFYGHFYMSNTTDMELASIDCDKGIAIEVKHDDKLTEGEGVYIQAALLYTSCAGQRRLRIINLSLQTCSQYADLYRSCDLDTVMNFYAKQSSYRLLEHSPKAVKDILVQRCAQTLACYRKHCAGPSTAGQLILPDCMKLMPLYLNCLLKSDAISGGADMTIDDRSFIMQAVLTMDVPSSVVFLYPRLIPIHDIDVNETHIPDALRCSYTRVVDNGAYILENGIHMFLWVGLNVGTDWIQGVFGVPSIAQANFEIPQLPTLDNPLSIRIRSLIQTIRKQRHRCMRLTLVRQRDKIETVFKHFLVEDRGIDGSECYVEFLCYLHKEIRTILS